MGVGGALRRCPSGSERSLCSSLLAGGQASRIAPLAMTVRPTALPKSRVQEAESSCGARALLLRSGAVTDEESLQRSLIPQFRFKDAEREGRSGHGMGTWLLLDPPPLLACLEPRQHGHLLPTAWEPRPDPRNPGAAPGLLLQEVSLKPSLPRKDRIWSELRPAGREVEQNHT